MPQDMTEREKLINFSEAARRYGCSPKLIDALSEQGILKEYNDGSRQRYFSVKELDAFFEEEDSNEERTIKRAVYSFKTAVSKLPLQQREAAEFVAAQGLADTVAYILGGSPSKRENETIEHLAQCIPAIPDDEKERFISLYKSLPEDIYASTYHNVALHVYRILNGKPEALSPYLDFIENSSRRDFTKHLQEKFNLLTGVDAYFPKPMP